MELSRGQQQHIVHWVPKTPSLKQIKAVLCGAHPDSARAGGGSLCCSRCQPGPGWVLPWLPAAPRGSWLGSTHLSPPACHPHLAAPHLWKHIAFPHQLIIKGGVGGVTFFSWCYQVPFSQKTTFCCEVWISGGIFFLPYGPGLRKSPPLVAECVFWLIAAASS